MPLILYYAPNACSLVPYVTSDRGRRGVRCAPAEFRQVAAHDARIFAAQS